MTQFLILLVGLVLGGLIRFVVHLIRRSHVNMTTDTARQKVEAGLEPMNFWISSEGEISHRWPDDTESYAGSINLKEVAEAAGLTWPCEVPVHLQERAFQKVEWAELVDPRENVLLRLHKHMRGIGSDLWRVYAGIDYTTTPATISLDLIIEFVLTEPQKRELEDLCRVIGAKAVNVMHQDYENPDREQIEVIFDILGKSLAEVCALQLRVLNDPVVLGFEGSFVSVL